MKVTHRVIETQLKKYFDPTNTISTVGVWLNLYTGKLTLRPELSKHQHIQIVDLQNRDRNNDDDFSIEDNLIERGEIEKHKNYIEVDISDEKTTLTDSALFT